MKALYIFLLIFERRVYKPECPSGELKKKCEGRGRIEIYIYIIFKETLGLRSGPREKCGLEKPKSDGFENQRGLRN